LYRDENSLDRNVIALVNSDVLTTQRGAATAAGNVDIDVTAFFVADYLITSAIPGVTDGGLDGFGAGWGFTDDKDGNPRIVPWSMGAYQY
jgi:hypothetical protein